MLIWSKIRMLLLDWELGIVELVEVVCVLVSVLVDMPSEELAALLLITDTLFLNGANKVVLPANVDLCKCCDVVIENA